MKMNRNFLIKKSVVVKTSMLALTFIKNVKFITSICTGDITFYY